MKSEQKQVVPVFSPSLKRINWLLLELFHTKDIRTSAENHKNLQEFGFFNPPPPSS